MSKPRKPVHIVAKLAEVAAFYEITEASLRVHWRPTMPDVCGKAGAWNLLEIGRWLATVYYQKQSVPEGEIGKTLAEAKLVKVIEDAKTARIKRQRMEEKLISRIQHEETLMTLSGWYASALDEAASIAEAAAPKSRKLKIEGQFERIRKRLREKMK